MWRPRAVAAEKPAVENTPPVAPQASSADPSGTYEEADLGGDRGGRSVAGCETGPHSLGALAVRPPGIGPGAWYREHRRVA